LEGLISVLFVILKLEIEKLIVNSMDWNVKVWSHRDFGLRVFFVTTWVLIQKTRIRIPTIRKRRRFVGISQKWYI